MMTSICSELPPLCTACNAVLPPPTRANSFLEALCRRCGERFVVFLPGWLPASEDLIAHYGRSVETLVVEFDHSFARAEELAREYFLKFTNPEHCKSMGVAVQDEDFFFHEGDMAERIQYYLVVRGDPRKFIEWRSQRNRDRRRDAEERER